MKCPVCKDVTLLMMDKNGIEIDYCPNCRGVWLDRGELEKLVQSEKKYSHENYDYDEKNNYNNSSGYYKNSHHKKKSFFEKFDIFD